MKNPKYLINKSNLESDWRALGVLSRELTTMLDDALMLSQHLMNVSEMRHLTKARWQLFQFRSAAEDAMYKHGGPHDLNIFYGVGANDYKDTISNARSTTLREVANSLWGPSVDGKITLTTRQIADLECGILPRFDSNQRPIYKQP